MASLSELEIGRLASVSWAGLGGLCEGFSDSVRSLLAQGFTPADAERVGESRM